MMRRVQLARVTSRLLLLLLLLLLSSSSPLWS